MNILDLIDTKVSSYTKTDRVIYEKLKKYPGKFVEQSYTELVKDIDVSPAALTRFAKKLGFNGFNEFQFQLSSDLQNRKKENTGSGMAEQFSKALMRTEESVSGEQLATAAEKLINAKKIFCLGFNASSLPARFLWDTLRSEFSFEVEMTDFDYIFTNYNKQDVIVLFSVSSGSFYHPFIQSIRKKDPQEQPEVIMVTMNPKHPLRKYCDDVILLPSAGGMYQSHAAALENMIFMMFNDMLVAKIRHTLNKK
ncbi:MAG: MurR/RpiR family transcriptional regulator [Solobacterium sp.]|nr:MurR/RpiR family transcriptional regulator [Solobacterium sp.]